MNYSRGDIVRFIHSEKTGLVEDFDIKKGVVSYDVYFIDDDRTLRIQEKYLELL